MLFPYNVDVGMQRRPWANWALIAATIVIGFPCWTNFVEYFTDANAGFFYLGRSDDFAWYQFLGYLFGHADPVHLLGNMWMLFLYGNAVNAKLGHWQYLLLYFGIGIVAAIIWFLTGDDGVTLGASGAVMGIVGAFVVLYPQNNVSIFYWIFIVKMGTWNISSYFVIAFYIILDFAGLLGGGGNVNHLVHVAGAGLGFGAMMAACATKLIEPDPGERTLLDIFRGKKARSRESNYNLRQVERFAPPPPPSSPLSPSSSSAAPKPSPFAVNTTPTTPRTSRPAPRPTNAAPSAPTASRSATPSPQRPTQPPRPPQDPKQAPQSRPHPLPPRQPQHPHKPPQRPAPDDDGSIPLADPSDPPPNPPSSGRKT